MAEVEEKRGWLYGLIGLGGGCLILVVIAAVAGFILLGKTGLIGSNDSFEPPAPSRIVETDTTFDAIQSALIKSTLSSLQNGEVSLVLTDEMLTVLMRDGLRQAGEEVFDVERAQIAIVDGAYLELFVPIETNGRETTLMAEIGLALDGSRVKASVGNVHVGNLKIPGNFATEASEGAIQNALDSQLDQVQGAIDLTELTLTEGELRLTGAVNLNPLQLLR